MADKSFVDRVTLLIESINDDGQKEDADKFLQGFKNGLIFKCELKRELQCINVEGLEEIFA